jgi:hypothetical protein
MAFLGAQTQRRMGGETRIGDAHQVLAPCRASEGLQPVPQQEVVRPATGGVDQPQHERATPALKARSNTSATPNAYGPTPQGGQANQNLTMHIDVQH